MQDHTRTMRVDSVDESGVFQMTLVTEGEASDGDILSIKGGQIPDRMPLLLSHFNDPTAIAGSVTSPVKDLKHTPPRLRAQGQIELDGPDGALKEIRRDVAFMFGKHGGAVSIRWTELEGGDPPVRRVNLPSNHPHFVDDSTETSWAKRSGLFWPSWKALEGSIVALGADSAAVADGRICAQRAAETEGEVAKFWRAMADDARRAPELMAAIEPEMANDEEFSPVGMAAGHSTVLEFITKRAGIARELGIDAKDLINAVTLDSDGQDFQPVTIGDEQVFLPQRLADQLAEEREERAETTAQESAPDPEPTRKVADQRPDPNLGVSDLPDSIDPKAVGRLISRLVSEHDNTVKRKVQKIIDLHTGKV